MYKLILIFIFSLNFVTSQTSLTNRQVEALLNQTGLSIDEAKEMIENNSGLIIDSGKDKLVNPEFDSDNREKTISQIQNIDDSESVISLDDEVVEEIDGIEEESVESDEAELLVTEDASYGSNLEYFGYNTFLGNPEIFQNSNQFTCRPSISDWPWR